MNWGFGVDEVTPFVIWQVFAKSKIAKKKWKSSKMFEDLLVKFDFYLSKSYHNRRLTYPYIRQAIL